MDGSVDELKMLLSCRDLMTTSEVMVLKLNPEQVKEIYRSIAKAVDSRLFMWLVRRLSDDTNYFDSAISFSTEDEELVIIEILDIFELESLDCNIFEQLYIQYAIKQFQTECKEFVFVREQQVYIVEKSD